MEENREPNRDGFYTSDIQWVSLEDQWGKWEI